MKRLIFVVDIEDDANPHVDDPEAYTAVIHSALLAEGAEATVTLNEWFLNPAPDEF